MAIRCKVSGNSTQCHYEIYGDVSSEEYQGLSRRISASAHVAGRLVRRKATHIAIAVDLQKTSYPKDIDNVIRTYLEQDCGKQFEFEYEKGL